MSWFDRISLLLQILTLAFASYFAYTQNLINIRQATLVDYVSISAVPTEGGIKLLNTGATNVYINSLDIDGEIIRYDRPLQIAAKTGDTSWFFVPITLETANKPAFKITALVTDEFGKHFRSEHGGTAADASTSTGRFSIWTYRTEPLEP